MIIAAALVAVVCCALPALIAGGLLAGALASVGACLGNIWLIVAALVVLAVVGVMIWRRVRCSLGRRPGKD